MRSIILLGTIFLSTGLSAQSLRGSAKLNTVSSSETRSGGAPVREKAMKYGNVEAYDINNRLVKSVITDENGNYDLNFEDTGTYHIKIMYAGYETQEETIKVLDNVESDFSLDRDITKKERVLSERVYSLESGYLGDKIILSENNKQKNQSEESSNGLTSGEINDFAKWDLWNDYLKTDLQQYQQSWQLNPQQRYVVQLTNEEKNPLVGATVSLLDKSGKSLWETISDNTGKAELWGNTTGEQQDIDKIRVKYNSSSKDIRSPKPFKKGINHLRFDENCGAPNTVEIAFVVDATGSMSDEINFIKRDLNKVMYNTQKLYDDVSIRYGSVFYRDKGEDYITRHKDFTNVLSEALVFVDEQFAKGGGDMPEAVDQGLDVAINQLSWSDKARTKLLFLVLDAPAHNKEENLIRIQQLARDAARKGIKIIPVTGSGINKSGEYLMRSLALCTNGTYVFLTDHSGIGYSHMAPTIDEYEMQLLTDRMTEIVKSSIYYPECESTIPDYDMVFPDSIVEFTLENGQVYPTPTSVDSSLIDQQDSTGRDRNDHTFHNEENIKTIEWKYYPNPTIDYVYVEAPEEIEFIYLTDLTGKLLQKVEFQGRQKVAIYLGDYPVGVYLLRYPIGKQWVTGKVVFARQ